MILTKINEQYSLKDITENNWNIEGTVTNTVENNINYNINITGEDGHIGDMNYYKPENGITSVNYNVTDSYKDAFIAYTSALTDSIIEYFKK